MDEHDRRMAIEQVKAHLARADSELEAALRFLDPKTDNEAEKDLVRALANARTSVGDGLETIQVWLGEPESDKPATTIQHAGGIPRL